MMVKTLNKKDVCKICKSKEKIYSFVVKNKRISLCEDCSKILYVEIGKLIIPKSPTNILKKDNRILIERF